MHSMARQIERSFARVDGRDLLRLGATVDEGAAWTFPDGSRGWILLRRVQVGQDSLGRVVWCYFEALGRETVGRCAHSLIYRGFTDAGEGTMEQVCAECRSRI
jgi:hypothetical protein